MKRALVFLLIVTPLVSAQEVKTAAIDVVGTWDLQVIGATMSAVDCYSKEFVVSTGSANPVPYPIGQIVFQENSVGYLNSIGFLLSSPPDEPTIIPIVWKAEENAGENEFILWLHGGEEILQNIPIKMQFTDLGNNQLIMIWFALIEEEEMIGLSLIHLISKAKKSE